MTRDEQEQFVADLCNGMRDRIQAQIRDGVVPEAWDGIELRELIAHVSRDNTSSRFVGERRKDYENVLLITPGL